MASFVESATLRVVDESSGQIAKINAQLKQLFATARSLKSTTVNIKFNTASLDQALSKVNKLKSQLNSIQNAKIGANIAAGMNQSTAAINRANTALQRMQLQMSRPLPPGAAAIGPLGRAGAIGPRTTGRRAAAVIGQPVAPAAGAPGGVAGGVFTGNMASMIAYHVAHGIYRAGVEGTKVLDVGENKLAMLQLTRVFQRALDKPGIFEVSAEDRALIKKYGTADAAAAKLIREAAEEAGTRPGGAFLDLGRRKALFAETFGTTASLTGAKQLNLAIEEMTMAGYGMGQSMEEAADKSYFYAKAADMMGRLTYKQAIEGHAAGTFRVEGATEAEIRESRRKGIAPPDIGMRNFFDYMLKIQPEIGKEMTGQTTALIAKYLGMTRMGVSNRAFGATLLLGEEMNTRAAVGYRQTVKQLQGIETANEKFMNLVGLGLITKYHKQGKKLVADESIDAPLLMQNMPEFLAKYVHQGQYKDEAMEHLAERDPKGFLMDKTSRLAKAEQFFKRPINLANIEDVNFLANKLAGNSNALDIMSAYIYNWAEIQRKLNIAEQRDPTKIREILERSPVVMMGKLQNQFQGVMGETIKGIFPIFAPAIEGLSNTMADVSQYIDERRQQPGADKELLAGLFKAGLGAAVAAPIVSTATGVVGAAFSALATPLGLISAQQGMTSQNPAIRTLSTAGYTLLAAGNLLQTAAGGIVGALAAVGLISAAALTRARGFLGPGLAGSLFLSGTEISDMELEQKRLVGEQFKHQQQIAALKAGTGIPTGATEAERARLLAERRTKGAAYVPPDMKAKFDEEIAQRQKELAVIIQSTATIGERLAAERTMKKYLDERQAERDKAKTARDAEEAKKKPRVPPPDVVPGRETTQFGDVARRAYEAREKAAARRAAARQRHQKRMQAFEDYRRERDSPTTTFGGRRYKIEKPPPTPAEAATSAITVATDKLASSTLSFAEVPGRLETVLSGGATTLASAGTTFGDNAASSIKSGASEAGTALGEAAVAKIQGAVIDVNVNINGLPGGASKGNRGSDNETIST